MQPQKKSLKPLLLLFLFCTRLSGFHIGSASEPAIEPMIGSAETAPLHLTVLQAVELAQLQNPQLQQLQDRLTLQQGKPPPRLRARLPRLFIEYSGSESYSWDTPYRLLHTLSGGFEIDLSDSGASWYRAQELKIEIKRTLLQIKELRQNNTLEVVQLCMQIFFHKRLADLLEEDLCFCRRLCRSADQRHNSGTISKQERYRINLETQEKELELEAEEIELQSLHSQLKLLLREGRQIELTGSLLQSGIENFHVLGQYDIADCRARAEQLSTEIAATRTDYRQAAALHSLQLRRLIPAVTVYSRIDFSGSDFPPATPALSFGLRVSAGAGRLAFSAENTVDRSHYSYGRSPAARAAIDLSEESGSSRRHTAEALHYARCRHRYSSERAGEKAEQLTTQLSHLTDLLKNRSDRCDLNRQLFEIRRQQFLFGTIGFEQLVEDREELTASLRDLLLLKQRYILTACRLLQHCALSDQITQLLKSFTGKKNERANQKGDFE